MINVLYDLPVYDLELFRFNADRLISIGFYVNLMVMLRIPMPHLNHITRICHIGQMNLL